MKGATFYNALDCIKRLRRFSQSPTADFQTRFLVPLHENCKPDFTCPGFKTTTFVALIRVLLLRAPKALTQFKTDKLQHLPVLQHIDFIPN